MKNKTVSVGVKIYLGSDYKKSLLQVLARVVAID